MASDRPLSLVVSNRGKVQRGTGPGQMSLPAAPLRPAMRGAPRPAVLTFCPDAVRARLAQGWPGLMLRKFSSDQACADAFGRTRQTASYWRSGHCKPDGPALALAWLMWPEECARMCGEVG